LWKWTGDEQHRQLAIQLPEAIERRALLEILARRAPPIGERAGTNPPAELAAAKIFSVPRVHGALPGRETIRIRAQQPLALVDWHFGHFRPEGPPPETGKRSF